MAKEDSILSESGRDRALALAVRHVNASTPYAMTSDLLLEGIRTGHAPPKFERHLHAFIDETHPATLMDLVISRAVSYGQLAVLADRLLPASHETRLWLDARRTF